MVVTNTETGRVPCETFVLEGVSPREKKFTKPKLPPPNIIFCKYHFLCSSVHD